MMETSQTLHGLFLEASKSFPSNPAVVFDDGAASLAVSYGTLAVLSSEVAVQIRREGVSRNQVIAVSGAKYDQVMIAVLGILQVPAAFVFIPPDAPARRTSDLLSRLQVSLLITCQELSEGIFAALNPPVHISRRTVDISGRSSFVFAALKPSTGHPDAQPMVEPSLAYAVCTSGTTGRPKLVRVPHQCIVPNITHLRKVFKIAPSDVIFNASPLTFDPSIVEMFLAFSTGATLVTVSDEVKRTPNRVLTALIKHKVSVLQVTPTFFFRFNQEQLRASLLSKDASLRILAFGGEPCPSLRQLSKWRSQDSQTDIFNLYGITEVSSWASCYRLCEVDTDSVSIPLGQPLLDTALEVRDESGTVMSEGEGKLFIGSDTRICYIDDEDSFPEQRTIFRDSGDYVKITPSGLVFRGRKDDQCKRFGKRFNLREVKQVLESVPTVLQCEITLDKSYNPPRLYAFFIQSSDSENHEIIRITESCQWLREQLKADLPEQGIPDYVFLIREFPLTHHGKVDVVCLTQWAQEYLERSVSSNKASSQQMTDKEYQDLIENHFKENLSLTEPLDKQKTFIELGGTSFGAVILVQRLQELCSGTDSELIDWILHRNLEDVFSRLISSRLSALKESEASLSKDDVTRGAGNGTSQDDVAFKYTAFALNGKISRQEENLRNSNENEGIKTSTSENWEQKSSSGVIHVLCGEQLDSRRGDSEGDFPQNTWSKRKKRTEQEVDLIHSSESVRSITRGSCVVRCNNDAPVATVEAPEPRQSPTLVLGEDWRVNLEKCIDASPLIVMNERFSHAVVFIGSHSGIFVAMDTVTTKRLWQVRLPDRIESSACLSPCKNFVAVGCYDNNVYFLDQYDGSLHWSFSTNGMVKSSPAASPDTGLVYVGSHDGKVYALNAVTKTCRFSTPVGGGSVFSSPCIDSSSRAIYSASLSGRLLSISWISGVVNWSYQCPKPLFSSPAVTSTGVVIGCVDGQVYCISHAGKLVYRLATEAPIFSSPCVVNSRREEAVLIGSHDGHVYCLTNGSVRWRTKIGQHVYSTPSCVLNRAPTEADCSHSSGLYAENSQDEETSSGHAQPQRESKMVSTNALIACCSTDGTFAILDFFTGLVLITLKLPGELFSSPVFTVNSKVIVACRNDNLYGFSLRSSNSPVPR